MSPAPRRLTVSHAATTKTRRGVIFASLTRFADFYTLEHGA